MTNNKLLDILSIFRQSREKLSNDFINEDLEIYTAMFEYEKHNSLMTLAIERYFTGYIDYHFELQKEFDGIDEEFSKVMLSFLKNFDSKVSDANLSNGKDLFSQLIEKKQKMLNKMIVIGNGDNNKYNKLLYSYQKDKTLFDREIRRQEKG